jgi:hypothetical protein
MLYRKEPERARLMLKSLVTLKDPGLHQHLYYQAYKLVLHVQSVHTLHHTENPT